MSHPRQADKPVATFVADLAAELPTPGGGAAAALSGALAAALAAMVGRYTTGRKRYAAVAETVATLVERADVARTTLVRAIDEDARAYAAVGAAQALPRATDEEIAVRTERLRNALVDAADVPLRVAVTCRDVLALCHDVARLGNPNLISDAGVAALLADAGLHAAAINVWANLAYLGDDPRRASLAADLDTHLNASRGQRDQVLALVAARHGGPPHHQRLDAGEA